MFVTLLSAKVVNNLQKIVLVAEGSLSWGGYHIWDVPFMD